MEVIFERLARRISRKNEKNKKIDGFGLWRFENKNYFNGKFNFKNLIFYI
jgi:hypothetical protein